MRSTMNVRNGLAAIALAAGILTLTACGSTQAGSPVMPQAGTASAPVSTPASIPTSAPTSEAPTQEPTTDPSTEEPTTDPSTEEPSTEEPTGSPIGDIDPDLAAWATNMCTDMGGLLATVFAYPTLTSDTPLGEYRQAFVDYYANVAQAASTALGNAQAGHAPDVQGGEEIHQAFITYLTALADISGNGAILVSEATDVASVDAAVQQISQEIGDLGDADFGIEDGSYPELQAAVETVPACTDMVSGG
ncbi:hypothetical protein GIS00_03725 [Nakamurella sp. YIM 132087]|uniref:Lipoprotein n=1 Tax=Nakamurella alba TaxID=2665158 RepID=A0A7K1FG12_9ACTN|nr:hypothetical protein [Nakamurella alba]MTD13055.1 hypothetical protein [Nakamurella alba]